MPLINTSHFNLYDDNGPLMTRVGISMMVISLLAMILRFVARRLVHQPLLIDDWLIPVSCVFSWATTIIEVWAVFGADNGRHFQLTTPAKFKLYMKCLYGIQMVYPPGIAAMKLSILFFYHRIFAVPSAKVPLVILGLITVAWMVTMDLMAIFSCTPIDRYWDKKKPGTCIPQVPHFIAVAVPNVVTDIIVIILPMPILWKLKMSMAHKIALTGVFLIGGLVVVLSCLRFVTVLQGNDSNDPTWAFLPHALFNALEMNIGILCACLPSMAPLLRLATGKNPRSTRDSSTYNHNTERTSHKLWHSKKGKIPGMSIPESNNGSNTWLNDAPLNESGSILRPKTSIHGPEPSHIELSELSENKIHVKKSVTQSSE